MSDEGEHISGRSWGRLNLCLCKTSCVHCRMQEQNQTARRTCTSLTLTQSLRTTNLWCKRKGKLQSTKILNNRRKVHIHGLHLVQSTFGPLLIGIELRVIEKKGERQIRLAHPTGDRRLCSSRLEKRSFKNLLKFDSPPIAGPRANTNQDIQLLKNVHENNSAIRSHQTHCCARGKGSSNPQKRETRCHHRCT